MVDQNSILWYTLSRPEWRNRQTRATQNRVGLTHVGSIPTSGIVFLIGKGWATQVHRGVPGRDTRLRASRFFIEAHKQKTVNRTGHKGLIRIIAGVPLGLALGFAIGWWLWPVQYTNTAPSALRKDYRDDYIVMVATAYEVEKDLELARERLELLNQEKPTAPVIELAERIIEANGNPEDIEHLAHLAAALGASPPTLAPYLEDQP